MSQKSLLDPFVLLMIDEGVNTSYQLQRRAGLSLGATIPSLRRLSRQGLIVADEAGARGRQEFRMTARGRHALRSWQDEVAAGKGVRPDLESHARGIVLAWSEGQLELVRELLRHGIAERRRRSQKTASRPRLRSGGAADLYRWMLAVIERERLRSEARVLTMFDRFLTSPPQSNRRSDRRG